MLNTFETATIIDIDQNASDRIDHNIQILSNKPAIIKTTSAEDFIQSMDQCDLALIDPQRRNTDQNRSRKGLYKLEDCTPNVLKILPQIKAKNILLKTSPMLDIDLAIKQLGCVSNVHIVEWNGECKELLFTLTPNTTPLNTPITAVKIDNNGIPLNTLTFTREEENDANIKISAPLKYLYEPSPAFMKSGAYKSIAAQLNISKLHPHTHLYTSQNLIKSFPGRSFEIITTYPAQSKALPFKKANLTLRNFPQDITTLKKKLKIKDGGDDYLFACTISDTKTNNDQRILLHCKKKKM